MSFSINLLELQEPGEDAPYLEAVKLKGPEEDLLILVSSVGGLVEGQRITFGGQRIVVREAEDGHWDGEECFSVQ